MTLPKLNTPTFELTLPSSGKRVKYRPFLVKEHKVLLTMAESDDTEVAKVIVAVSPLLRVFAKVFWTAFLSGTLYKFAIIYK